MAGSISMNESRASSARDLSVTGLGKVPGSDQPNMASPNASAVASIAKDLGMTRLGSGRKLPNEMPPPEPTPTPSSTALAPAMLKQQRTDPATTPPWNPAGLKSRKETEQRQFKESVTQADVYGDLPPFWDVGAHGPVHNENTKTGQKGRRPKSGTNAEADSKLPRGHWTKKVKSASKFSNIKRKSSMGIMTSVRESLHAAGGSTQQRRKWLDSLPAVERLQSLRMSLDRDRASPEFMPWTSAVDPRISKQDWEDNAEYAIRKATATLERCMRDHLDRLVAKECFESQSPCITPIDLLKRSFMRWDIAQGGVIDLQGFMHVWNVELELEEEVDALRTSAQEQRNCHMDPIFGKLVRRRLVSPNAAASIFCKHGCDRDGLLPYKVFISGLLSAPSRLLGMEQMLNKKEDGRNGLEVGGSGGGGSKGDDPNFSGRILYPKCKSAVFPPTHFDPEAVKRSACPPKASMRLEHVYGYAGISNAANNLFYLQSHEVVYFTAAVGIVFSKENWRANKPCQRFFFGHDNDIECLNVHPNRRFVVTGQQVQVGGVPFCCIWDAIPDGDSTSDTCPQLQRLDHPKMCNGMRQRPKWVRSVLAACFSTGDVPAAKKGTNEEGRLLVTVGADNRHTCFVWDWAKGCPLQKAEDPSSLIAPSYFGPPKKAHHAFYPSMDHALNPGKSRVFQSQRLWNVSTGSMPGATKVSKKAAQQLAKADGSSGGAGGNGEAEAPKGDGTSELLANFPTIQGAPPQVFGVIWNPFKPAHKGMPEFLTYGVNHVKSWNLIESQWVGTQGTFGSDKVDVVLSATFVPMSGPNKCALLTGFPSGKIGIWTPDSPLPQCTYKLVRILGAHEPGPKIITPEGKVTYSGVRVLKLHDPGTLLSGGADGVVMTWDLNDVIDSQGVIKMCARGHPKQKCGPDRFALEIPGFMDSISKCIRGLDSIPSMPDCFIAGTDQCDIWEVDKDPEVLVYGHAGDLHTVAPHPLEPGVFATVCESKRVYVWNAIRHSLTRTAAVPIQGSAVAFSQASIKGPAGIHGWEPKGGTAHHLAVGGMQGKIQIMDADNLQPLKLLKNAVGTIKEIRYTPQSAHRKLDCGHLMAAASRDLNIYIYDVLQGYQLKVRCVGHTATVAHLDWTLPLQTPLELKDRTLLMSNCNAYELLYWDPLSGKQIRQNMRDTQMHTQSCVIGFPVMGIWPDGSDGTDVNAVDRSTLRSRDGIKEAGFLVTADDYGTVKLFNYPVVNDDAPFRTFKGHASHVMSVRFTCDDKLVMSVGGKDRAIMQFRTHGISEQEINKHPVLWCDVDACEYCGRNKPQTPAPPPQWIAKVVNGVEFYGHV